MPKVFRDELLRYAMKNGIFAVMLCVVGWFFATQVYLPQQARFDKFLDQQVLVMGEIAKSIERTNVFHENQRVCLEHIIRALERLDPNFKTVIERDRDGKPKYPGG